jgi:hypothetical protein
MNRVVEATAKLNDLWNDLPMSVQRVYEALMDIKDTIALGESLSFAEDDPRNDFVIQLDVLLGQIDQEYDDPDERPRRAIDSSSPIYGRIELLRTLMNAFVEYSGIRAVLDTTLKGIHERLERVEATWPPKHFDFRRNMESLRADCLSPEVLEHFRHAIEHFDHGKCADVLTRCGKIGEALTTAFAAYLSQFGIEIGTGDWYPKLEAIRSRLVNTRDVNERSLGTTRRLEWYVLFLLQNIYWLRNAASHEGGRDETLPEWMDRYRRTLVDRVDQARLALVCALQAAIELQELIEHRHDSLLP